MSTLMWRVYSLFYESTLGSWSSEIVVGSFHDVPVRLIKDDEFADRFWFRAYGGGPMVEFVLRSRRPHRNYGYEGSNPFPRSNFFNPHKSSKPAIRRVLTFQRLSTASGIRGR